MEKTFNSVTLVGKTTDPNMQEYLRIKARMLRECGVTVTIEATTAQILGITDLPSVAIADIGEASDLVIVLGGDGTMLATARELLDADVPLVGINHGRLGFLTDITNDALPQALMQLLQGQYIAEHRILLGAQVLRNDTIMSEARALNDIVISKGGMARLIELDLTIDRAFVHRQRSDGLIVSTPTGTTAYALSAGGPLLHPTLEAMALVPICPHTLSNRPFAIDSRSIVDITLVQADDARIHFDGQLHAELQEGDRVIVRRLDKTITLLHPPGHSHYEILREKLNWG